MAKSTLADKRRWRKMRKEGLRLKAQLRRTQQAIVELVLTQLPDNYCAYFDERNQLVIQKTDWLDQIAARQLENASHWLNDRGLF